MKKIFSSIIVLFCAQCVFAQLSVNNNMVWSTNGLWIGCDSLQVPSFPRARIELSTIDGSTALRICGDYHPDDYYLNIISGVHALGGRSYIFRVKDLSGPTDLDAMKLIAKNGTILIKKLALGNKDTIAQKPLHIFTHDDSTALRICGEYQPDQYYLDILSRKYGDGDRNYEFRVKDIDGLQDSAVLTIVGQNGNIGIGKSSPVYKLDVNGSTNINGNTTINGSIGVGTISPSVKMDVNGDIALHDSTPPALQSVNNNYQIGNHSLLRLKSNQSATITGFSGGVQGKVLWIINVGYNTIILADQSPFSSPSNRIIGSVRLSQNQTSMLWYDSTTQRWRVLK